MKSLFEYIQESMFKNPLDAMESYDLDGMVNNLKEEETFPKGYDELQGFVKDTFTKFKVKEDEYPELDDERCYAAFLKNKQVADVSPAPFAVKIYMGNQDKTITIGGNIMEIDGVNNIPTFYKKIEDGCHPSSELEDIKVTGMVELDVWKISETITNIIFKKIHNMIKECGEGGAATPGNTMGMGDPVAPGPGQNDLGSGDAFQFNPRKPAFKKEKKNKSKTQK